VARLRQLEERVFPSDRDAAAVSQPAGFVHRSQVAQQGGPDVAHPSREGEDLAARACLGFCQVGDRAAVSTRRAHEAAQIGGDRDLPIAAGPTGEPSDDLGLARGFDVAADGDVHMDELTCDAEAQVMPHVRRIHPHAEIAGPETRLERAAPIVERDQVHRSVELRLRARDR
jgi:hypothetical protein